MKMANTGARYDFLSDLEQSRPHTPPPLGRLQRQQQQQQRPLVISDLDEDDHGFERQILAGSPSTPGISTPSTLVATSPTGTGRSPGDYSGMWKGSLSSPYNSNDCYPRTSSETVIHHPPEKQDRAHSELPAKYIGPEMRRASSQLLTKRHKAGSGSGFGGGGRPGQCCSFPTLRRQSVLWWLPEFAWVVFSFVCFVVIFAVLRGFDRQSPPEWPGALNLNVFLALLTSLATSAYVVPVISGLGQLRWLRFSQKARPLKDFDAIDQASRGLPYGSLRLLFGFKGGPFGLMGALIMLLGLFTPPVTQQVISYSTELRRDAGGTAKAGRLVTFSRNTGSKFLTGTTDAMEIKKAIVDGAYARSRAVQTPNYLPAEDSVVCSTTNCTYPAFSSLGVCTKAVNITNHLKLGREADTNWEGSGTKATSYSATLPSINATLVAPNMHSFAFALPPSPSISFKGSEIETWTAIADAYVIYSNPSFAGGSPSFHAAEMLFHWCAQRHTVTSNSNEGTVRREVTEVPSTMVSDNLATSLAYQFLDNSRTGSSACLNGQEDCRPEAEGGWGAVTLRPSQDPAPSPEFVVEELTGLYLSKLLVSAFMGPEGGVNSEDSGGGLGGQFLQGLNPHIYKQEGGDLTWPFGVSLFPDPYHPSDPAAQFRAIEKLAGNIALSVTGWMVGVSDSFVVTGNKEASADDGENDPSVVVGTAWTRGTRVIINWEWLSFLLIQIILSAGFLVAIAAWTRTTPGMQVLKTSSLAGMVALDDEGRRYLQLGSNEPGDAASGSLEERASSLCVKLLDRTGTGGDGGTGVQLRTTWLETNTSTAAAAAAAAVKEHKGGRGVLSTSRPPSYTAVQSSVGSAASSPSVGHRRVGSMPLPLRGLTRASATARRKRRNTMQGMESLRGEDYN